MCPKAVNMFGHAYLILKLFLLLTFLSPQTNIATVVAPKTSFEVVITSGHQNSPAIVELISLPNQLIDTSQTSKLPIVRPFDGIQTANPVTPESQLYFKIGNAIELKLNTTTIIFPFHCFT